jgi:hypothetical protein
VEDGDSEDDLVASFACVAVQGTNGCGFEQPLEAALKALTPSTSATRFHAGTTGHGDGDNAGFLREDSILAVLVVTDEDDCSAANPALFDLEDPSYPEGFEMRCAAHEDDLHPLRRYLDGFRALRADHPSRFMFGAITGVPEDLVADPAAIDYAAILADPRMEIAPHPFWEGLLRPSCEVTARGSAYPPRRLVRLVRDFGEQAVVTSICSASFASTTEAVLSRLGTTIRRVGCEGE